MRRLRRQGLVEQQDARAIDERPSERNALQLAARQLVCATPLEILQTDESEDVGDPGPDVALRRPGDPEPEGDVLENVEVAEREPRAGRPCSPDADAVACG